MSKNVAASIKARLYNKAQERDIEFQSFLVRYAGERFLYRLGASSVRDSCILKGATLLAIWMEEPYRATGDIDLLAFGKADETAIREVMATICNVNCPEDGLTFDLNNLRINSIRSGQTYSGQRVRLNCYLEKTTILIQVDFGFGDVLTSGSQEARLQTLIDGVPVPSLRVYPLVTSVSEKFEAMVRFQQGNSRMKDFHDVWALSDQFPFDGEELREAIQGCFERRGTDWTSEIPVALTSAFYSDTDHNTLWSDYRRGKDLMTPPPETFDIVGEHILKFLAPIRDSILADARFRSHWPAGGPWQRLRPYPTYKDSGVGWLGEIPAHWEVKRLKYAATLNPTPTEARNRGESLEVSFVPMEAIGEYGGLELTTTKLVGEVYTGYTYFREGDVVVAKITPCFENGKGAVATGLVNEIAFGTTELHVLRIKESIDRQFLFYLSMGDAFRRLGEAEMYGAGGQKRVPDSFVRNLMHPLPPLPEQRAIAAILDRETAKIDALVAKKERLIELLQEKRTALISDAVTKGLDPDVPLKDSGVEWLGEIPAHWDSKRLKTISRIRYGLGQPPRESSKGLPLIRATNVTRGRITEKDMVYVDPDDVPIGRDAFLAEGEIIVVRSGAYTADSAIVPKTYDGAVTGYDMVVTVNNALAEFVAVALLCTYVRDAQLVISSMRSAQPHLNAEELGAAVILLPPIPEQRAIAAFLDRETAKIDALVAKVQEAIDRLKELRTALISAAVTGKIDVREAAA